MSFFPLWKLKGSKSAVTPSTWAVHLEEKSSDEEEGINGDDPDGIKDVTKEFIVCLTRAVMDAQQAEKHCYHCDSPDYFIRDCPWLAGMEANLPLNWRKGTVPRKGAQAPQGKATMPEVSLGRTPQVQNTKCRLPSWIPIPLPDGMGLQT